MGEDNEEEDSKCSRKKKPKLSLKADSKEEEERDDEMVSTPKAAPSAGFQCCFCDLVLPSAACPPTLCVCHCPHLKMRTINGIVPLPQGEEVGSPEIYCWCERVNGRTFSYAN